MSVSGDENSGDWAYRLPPATCAITVRLTAAGRAAVAHLFVGVLLEEGEEQEEALLGRHHAVALQSGAAAGGSKPIRWLRQPCG